MDDVKLPWYIDLLNINLENHDLTEAKAANPPARGSVPEGRDTDHGESGLLTEIGGQENGAHSIIINH